ncbi:MAG: hypothetical protein IPM85_15135 [Chitinophagaceae bacterium]|nr:hypothetical protein [Chitinophagaceae bacterium]
MTKHLLLLLIPVTILTHIGCNQANKKPDTEKAISDLIKKYPQLPIGSGKQSDYYKLIRTIIIGDKNIELQLRSSPDTLDDPQKIILTINSKKEVYAIPFFSNTYHDFWNFQFDSILTSIKPTNTTLQKELENCLETLSLNDTSGTASTVINELFFSLLHCERITEGDSIFLNAPALVDNSSLKEEDSDSCTIRLHKNWQAITKEFHPKDYILNYNAYWDDKNNRIYQLNFIKFNRRQKISFNIKTYRQDCIFHLMYL